MDTTKNKHFQWNPTLFTIKKQFNKDMYIVTAPSNEMHKIIAFGFQSEDEAQIWIDEQVLYYALN